MPLVNVKTLLRMADAGKTSVLAFICIDYNMVSSVIRSAEEKRKPAVIMLLPEHVTAYRAAAFKPFAEMVRTMAEAASVPVALHLDHSYSEQEVYQAIEAGFTSVMFDASGDTFERNVVRTRNVVNYAHSRRVSVEAELGSVGIAARGDNRKTDFFTDPDKAALFCEQTDIDALAVAIGNAHGDYPFVPSLDIERLVEINGKTDTPLVLHGGSGIPDEQLREAFSKGINKFNYGTDVLRCYDQAVRKYHENCQPPRSLDVLGLPQYVQDAMTELIRKKLELCRLNV